MAYPANLAVTNWGSLQSGNTADIDTNFRNVVTALNGIGNGTSVLQTVAISTAGISQANITTISGGNASFFAASLTTPLGIGSGGTNTATFSNNAVIVITAGSMTGILPAANGTVLTSNGTAWGPAPITQNSGFPASGPVTNSLGSDVNLANTTVYFNGPSVSVGNVGTWFASGTVVLQDATSAVSEFQVKLWDGITVISSCALLLNGTGGQAAPVSLSGVISAPAGNIRISVIDISTASGKILFNTSGNAKDSTITAYRIL